MASLSADFEKQQRGLEALQKRKDLGYLLSRVCDAGAEKLLRDENFVKPFEEAKACSAYILAIDIRRSTDLMLRGKTNFTPVFSTLSAACSPMLSRIAMALWISLRGTAF
jgi:hypothetical protein